MALAGAAVAERDHVISAQDQLAEGEFQHQHLVEAGDRGGVEYVEALDGGDPGLPMGPSTMRLSRSISSSSTKAQHRAGMIDAITHTRGRPCRILAGLLAVSAV